MKKQHRHSLIQAFVVASLILLVSLTIAAQNDPTTTGSTAQTAASGTKKTSARHHKRRHRKHRAAQSAAATSQSSAGETTDAASVPKATEVGNKLNQQGEVGAQAKDNARETTSGGNRRSNRNKKFIPTPAPPMKPGQPSEQAGEVAPTPAPAKPIKP